jgi:phenylalanyl-tRNA synthetase alpha chain
MQDQLSSLLAKAAAELPGIRSRPELEAAKARYVGPNGELTALMKQMGSVPKEERPAAGKLINETKGRLQALLDASARSVEDSEIAAQLGPAPDPPPQTPVRAPSIRSPRCAKKCAAFCARSAFPWPTDPRLRPNFTASTL